MTSTGGDYFIITEIHSASKYICIVMSSLPLLSCKHVWCKLCNFLRSSTRMTQFYLDHLVSVVCPKASAVRTLYVRVPKVTSAMLDYVTSAMLYYVTSAMLYYVTLRDVFRPKFWWSKMGGALNLVCCPTVLVLYNSKAFIWG